MGNPLVEKLTEERESAIKLVESLTRAAQDAGRDLSEQDLDTIKRTRERVTAIDTQLEAIADNWDLSDDLKSKLARHMPGVSAPLMAYRSSGEVLYDVLHQDEQASAHRLQRAMQRAAQHMGTDAAKTTATAGDLKGLYVDPVVGPVIDPIPGSRPFLDALGITPADDDTFSRPYLEDPNVDADYVQALQKGELKSFAFDVKKDNVELTTVGTYLNVSVQLIRFKPGSLTVIVSQLNKRLTRATERAAIVEMAKSTSKVTLAAAATGQDINDAVFEANEIVTDETGEPAEWIAFGPKGLTRLGTAYDLAGRPLFPFLGPANAMGQASVAGVSAGPAGLRPVQTWAITDNTFWVGNGAALEAYEYRYPLMEALEPSVLGRQVAVASSFAISRTRSTSSDDGPPPTGGLGAVHLAP